MQLGPGFVPTFLYYFVGTTFIVAFVVSQQSGVGLDTGGPYQIGIFLGLVAGLTGAYFNQNLTTSVPFKNKLQFQQALTDGLTQLGFAEDSQFDEFTVYKRQSLGGLFTVKLFIQVEKQSATISGRSSTVKALRKKLPN